MLITGAAGAAEFSIHPFLSVSEEYTDNVFETRDARKTDYITRVLPGITLRYNAPLWDWDIAYNYDYRYYARHSRDDDNTHNLAANGQVRIIENFLFLDVSDTYRRISLDVTRDKTQESLFVNQSDSNVVTASPYFQFHPGPKVTMKTGYRYSNYWYRDPAAIDKREHSGFMDVTYEYSPKLSFSADYTYTHQNSRNENDRQLPSAGAKYQYADKSFVFAQGGYMWLKYRGGGSFNNPFWSAGITHSFEPYTVYFNTSSKYSEDPLSTATRETDYTIGLNRDFKRGSAGVSLYYSRFVEENVNGTSIAGSNATRTTKYGSGITARYDLTEKLTGNLAASAEKYDQSGSYTRRIYVNPALAWSMPMDITLFLNYAFIDYYSPGIFADNYHVNRIFLEVKKVF